MKRSFESMQRETKLEVLGRILASLGAIIAVPGLLTFDSIYVPDDGFTSDIVNGELPARVLLGRMLASGDLPLWSSEVGGGTPIGAGLLGEPLGAFFFALFSPAVALSLFALTLLLFLSHGTYSFTRRLGANPLAAAFAATAFAGSGYVVSQLRHLSIIGTIAFLPLGLAFLDDALSEESPLSKRLTKFALFGLVVGEQGLAGFPQSLYISLVAYSLYGATLLASRIRRERSARRAGVDALALGGSIALGLGVSLLALLPLFELGSQAGRTLEYNSYWIHRFGYDPRHFLTFLVPYLYGDGSEKTYRLGGLFWEVYGYVGLSTVLLAPFAFVFDFRNSKLLGIGLVLLFGVLAILGPHTPAFTVLWHLPIGMNKFRFWTRFLVLVDLSVAVLAGYALSAIMTRLARESVSRSLAFGALLLALLAADLGYHQRRQNPFVSASVLLEPPTSVKRLLNEKGVRIHSLGFKHFHLMASRQSAGWKDSAPLSALFPSLPPNLPALWGLPSIDVYSGAGLESYVDMFGDHNRPSLFPELARVVPEGVFVHPKYIELLRLQGVTHVLSPKPILSLDLKALVQEQNLFVYPIGGRRAYSTQSLRLVTNQREAVKLLLGPVDARTSLVATKTPGFPREPVTKETTPIALEVLDGGQGDVLVDVRGIDSGFVYLADAFAPNITATLDGEPLVVARANVFGRAVHLPRPGKILEFHYEAWAFSRALPIAFVSFATLVVVALLGARARRRQPEEQSSRTPGSPA